MGGIRRRIVNVKRNRLSRRIELRLGNAAGVTDDGVGRDSISDSRCGRKFVAVRRAGLRIKLEGCATGFMVDAVSQSHDGEHQQRANLTRSWQRVHLKLSRLVHAPAGRGGDTEGCWNSHGHPHLQRAGISFAHETRAPRSFLSSSLKSPPSPRLSREAINPAAARAEGATQSRQQLAGYSARRGHRLAGDICSVKKEDCCFSLSTAGPFRQNQRRKTGIRRRLTRRLSGSRARLRVSGGGSSSKGEPKKCARAQSTPMAFMVKPVRPKLCFISTGAFVAIVSSPSK